MDESYGDGPRWTLGSGWNIATQVKRWSKRFLGSVPGRIGSGLRRRLYCFESVGDDVFLSGGLCVEYSGRLRIGEHVGVNQNCFINAGGGVSISDWVLISPGATVHSQDHDVVRLDAPLAMADDVRRPVSIGEGAWLAANWTVLAGVIVGRGAIVAADAVVTQDLPQFAIVGGVPARVLWHRSNSGDV